MTYVLADTQYLGKKWASIYLGRDEKFKVLSTGNQIRGRAFLHTDCIYITTTDRDLTYVLIPALIGAKVFSSNEWITDQWRQKYAKKNLQTKQA